jgi:phospholipid/cholesterol/gamma-HCH transport system ATP-binding protein
MNTAESQIPPDAAVKTDSSKSVIEIKGLEKSFGDQKVLNGISLNLYDGENLVILGRSGTGKSVLIKCIIGLLIPDAGKITVFGQDVNALDSRQLNELRQKVGFLFQNGALYDSMTVRQNLEFSLRRIKRQLTEKEITDKVHEVLENVGLADQIDKTPAQLSGGMQKRISLARTIIVDPSIMLYDEPTTGLDPITSVEISDLINDVRKKYKTSSIVITHDIKCARSTASRVIMVKDGTVYKEGMLEEFEKSSDPVISDFFK